MSVKDTGGPAFPVIPPDTHNYREWPAESGMTLRDYFAAKALPLAWAIEQELPTGPYRGPGMQPTYVGAATRAYFFADAMLAERAK
jgi:hypothetical protein